MHQRTRLSTLTLSILIGLYRATVLYFALLTLALLIAACGGGGDGPGAPSPTASMPAASSPRPIPFSTQGDHTLSGIVFETSSGAARPVEGAGVQLWVEMDGGKGFSYEYVHGWLTTDAAGRYTTAQLPDSRTLVTVVKPGYVQPCVLVADVHTNIGFDVELTSVASLAVTGPPSPRAIDAPTLSGVVFETTPEGPKPIEGVQLAVEVVLDRTAAHTVSDTQGRYLLCRLQSGIWGGLVTVYASKAGYALWWQTIRPDQDLVLNIELTRR